MRGRCYKIAKCKWAVPVGDGLKYCPFSTCPGLKKKETVNKTAENVERLYNLVSFAEES